MKNPFEIYTTSKPQKRKSGLDFEESAADSQSLIEDPFSGDRNIPKQIWLGLLLAVCFAVFVGRIFYLQVIKGSSFRALSENNRVRSQPILAPRGLILDRNGKSLAQNTASFNLVAVPFDLPKQGLDNELQKLAEGLGLNLDDLRSKLANADKKSVQQILIAQNQSSEKSILFDTRSAEFPGFSMQKIPVRDYVEPEIFSHVLGFTGLISQADLKSIDPGKYESVDFIGKSGIESMYEKYLHGSNGQNLLEVDASGKLLNLLGENDPIPGQSLILNIDKELQDQLYSALKSRGNAKTKAAAVAMNPKNGQVLAFLSLPGFNNSLFARGISQEDYNKLLTDKSLPLFNRVIVGTYPPGSTVKPMVAAAALSEGVVNPSTVIYDNGVLVIPNQYDPSINYNFYGWKRQGLGPMTITSAIAQSSDIYFYTVAGGNPHSSTITGLGAEKLAEYYRKFNLGKITGIDLPGEKSGLVADPAWKALYYKSDAILSKWYLGDTYHIAIGQGDMLATPLQVSEWTAIIANNGIGFKPTVLNKVVDSTTGKIVFESKPQVLVNKFISDENLKIIQEGMRDTVVKGSGRQLATLPISAAGKTGTSQFDGSDPLRTHAWFTAYAPFEDPQIVITVLVEAGGEGHIAAVPVAKQVLEWWAKNRYKQ